MYWPYILVFIGAFLTDVSVVPLPPAFTVMIFLQIQFKLSIWPVICIGVAGSILGRYLLTLYVPRISGKLFKASKNEDVQFLGKKMEDEGWKCAAFVIFYSLLPLPTTPLFVAAGMGRVRPIYVIPAFIIGKFTSDAMAVFSGKYAAENTVKVLQGIVSWESITGFLLALVMLFILFFIDWRTLLVKKQFRLTFNVWK